MPPDQETTEALAVVAEAVAESEAEAPTNENDVAIAAIEAEKEITIAAIHAEQHIETEKDYNETRVEVAEIEAAQEQELWPTIHRLQSTIESLQAQVTAMQTPLVIVEEPPLSSLEDQATVETMAEMLTETNLIQNSTIPTDEQMQTDHSLSGNDDANPVEDIAAAIAKPIIRLV